jgi:arsenate reductase
MSAAYNVLFLCTGNSGRSILSEGLLNLLGRGRFRAFSAGSQPAARPNPLALELLQQAGCDIRDLRSKSWLEFEAPDAPQMDIVITVCANAAAAPCPVWPGHPATAHWSYDDPVGDDDAQRRAAFARVFQQIRRRIEALCALPDESLAPAARKTALQSIGALPLE